MNVNIDPETLPGPDVPANLRVGDIIRCVIPTDVHGRREYPARNALVVGLECVPGEATIRGLHLVRFSYNIKKFNPDFEFEVTQPQQAEWRISGFYKSVLVRTNRVDLVPVDHVHFGEGIKVIGHVTHPEFFATLGEYLKRGLSSEEAETSRVLRKNFYATELRQTLDPDAPVPVPAFDLAAIAGIKRESFINSADFDIAVDDVAAQNYAQAAGKDYSAIVSAQRKSASAQMEAPVRFERPKPPLSERDYISPHTVKKIGKGRKARLARDRIVSSVNGSIRRKLERAGIVTVKEPIPPAPVATPAIRPCKTPWEPLKPRFVRLPDGLASEDANPVLGDLFVQAKTVERKNKVSSATRPEPAPGKPSACMAMQQVARDYVPQIRDDLMRGDIVFADVIDFVAGARKTGNFRPCIVWDVYENAEGKITGLDLLGCTRQMGQFTHAVEVHNVTNPALWDGGRVITEKLIRVPFTAQYFQAENKHRNYYSPYFVDQITQQRADLLAQGLDQTPYGLSDVPDDWKLRAPVIRPHTEKTLDAAQRFEKTRLAQAPVITSDDIAPGSVIMRAFNTAAGKKFYRPALVWGIWRHNDSNAIVAVDTMRISLQDRQNAWEMPNEKLAASLNNDNAVIQVTRVDMIPNTNYFFDEGANTPVMQLDAEMMRRLERERMQGLLKVRRRKGIMPREIHANWVRTAGFTHHIRPERLAAPGVFAPDVPALAEPGRKREPATRQNRHKARPA